MADRQGVQVAHASLGGSMLLASHCIVLVNHYLDVILHTCPSQLWERPCKALVKQRKQRQANQKARLNRQQRAQADASTSPSLDSLASEQKPQADVTASATASDSTTSATGACVAVP